MKTKLKCHCGRLQSEAAFVISHSAEMRYTYYRCACGFEWTVQEHDVDVRDAVTSDEVLEVKKRLAKFEGTFSELLG